MYSENFEGGFIVLCIEVINTLSLPQKVLFDCALKDSVLKYTGMKRSIFNNTVVVFTQSYAIMLS